MVTAGGALSQAERSELEAFDRHVIEVNERARNESIAGLAATIRAASDLALDSGELVEA